jgi:hypothetical protein
MFFIADIAWIKMCPLPLINGVKAVLGNYRQSCKLLVSRERTSGFENSKNGMN